MADEMKNMAYWKAKHATSEGNSPINYGQANRDVVSAQKSLTDIENAYRAPAWTGAAQKIVSSAQKPFSSSDGTSDDSVENGDNGESTEETTDDTNKADVDTDLEKVEDTGLSNN